MDPRAGYRVRRNPRRSGVDGKPDANAAAASVWFDAMAWAGRRVDGDADFECVSKPPEYFFRCQATAGSVR